MKLSSVLVIATTLVIGSTSTRAQTGCGNLFAGNINKFFASLELSTLPDINAGAAGSLTNIKVTGLNKVKIGDLSTDENVCDINKLTLTADELQINAHYDAVKLTIPNLVSDLTGSGEIKIVVSSVTLQLELDVNILNCFEIKDARNLIPSISTGRITLSGNPEKEGEVNQNAINWVTTDLIELLNVAKPQILQFLQPHLRQSLNCSC